MPELESQGNKKKLVKGCNFQLRVRSEDLTYQIASTAHNAILYN